MRRARRIAGFGLMAVVTVAGLALLPGQADAQMRFTATAGSAMGGGQISKRSVDRYAELLGFSADQKESANSIYDGYAAAYQDAVKARRSAMQDVRRSSEDTGDATVFMEKMPGIEKEFRSKTQKLEKGLFDDLRAMVSGANQEAKWVRVERMHRREVGLRGGVVSGESVDLVDVVDGLKLPSDALSAVAPNLEEYEVDIDHQLQAKTKPADDASPFELGKSMDMDKMKKQAQESREAGLKIKEANERSARKIEPLLPEDKRAAFRDAIKQRSFPQVFRPSRAIRDMDAALKLDDLSASQKASIAEIKSRYQRDVAPLNDAWATAIAASEGDGQQSVIMGGDGGKIMLNMAEDPPALVDARKARRELDDKTNEKLKGILNESQQAKVAKTSESDAEEGASGMMIKSIMVSDSPAAK
jgi:hypothetical protein